MFYYIKITSETGKEIEIDARNNTDIQKFLKSVVICVDTVDDNVSNRASNVLNRVNVTLDIDSTTKAICKDLMDWALASSGEDVYRLVHIDVYDDKEQVIRSFDIQKMFVEDYQEAFINGQNCVAELKLIQQANNAKNFLHDVARL